MWGVVNKRKNLRNKFCIFSSLRNNCLGRIHKQPGSSPRRSQNKKNAITPSPQPVESTPRAICKSWSATERRYRDSTFPIDNLHAFFSRTRHSSLLNTPALVKTRNLEVHVENNSGGFFNTRSTGNKFIVSDSNCRHELSSTTTLSLKFPRN